MGPEGSKSHSSSRHSLAQWEEETGCVAVLNTRLHLPGSPPSPSLLPL